jgi:hypothetical protein
LKFLNIAAITLLLNFNLELDILEDVPILKGKYDEFSVEWYKDIGVALCITIIIESFVSYASKIAKPLFHCAKRCWDRSGRCSLKNRD